MPFALLGGLLGAFEKLVSAVAEDVGALDSVQRIDLVGFEKGSSCLVFEEEVERDRPPILTLVFDAQAARAAGRAVPPLLTGNSVRALERFEATCHRLAEKGAPVRFLPGGTKASVAKATAVVPIGASYARTEFTPAEDLPEELFAADTNSNLEELLPPSWAIRLSGTIQRLDSKLLKMWINVDGIGLVDIPLTREQFAEADADQARWKHVHVLARSRSQRPGDIDEILELEPTAEVLTLAAEPLTDGANALEAVLQRLGGFTALGAKWDSYNAKAINRKAISAAASFITSAARVLSERGKEFVVPFAVPLASGAVQLEWDCGSRFLELEFENEKNSIRFLRGTNSTEFEGDVSRNHAYELVAWVHEAEGK